MIDYWNWKLEYERYLICTRKYNVNSTIQYNTMLFNVYHHCYFSTDRNTKETREAEEKKENGPKH